MLRCLLCGCSRFDPQGYKCALCGVALGDRDEQCYVTEDTKTKLMAHAEELKVFGVALEQQDVIKKSATSDAAGYLALALAVAESLNSGVLRKLVLYLRRVEIPKDEILRLRLDEPDVITGIFTSEKSNDGDLKT